LVRALSFLLVSPRQVRQAVTFGRRHGVELVWAEFQEETLLVAARVAAGLKVPLVGTIWDDPEGWLADGGYDPLYRRLLLARFREALRGARRVSVVSSAMQEAYRREYGLDSLILRYGHDLEDASALPQKQPQQQGIVVGFAGNVYGEDAWRSFLKAVARLNAGGSLPPIKIQAFGRDDFPYSHDGVEVACQGWLPRGELLRRLAGVDFCYLPYWFMPNRRRHAGLSFPTKLTTYLAAGRPVLYHGPEYADVSRIMRTWGLGLSVHSLASEDIGAAVTRLARDLDLQRDCQRAAATAFRLEFNSTVMKRNFAQLIGVAPDYLEEKVAR
jgi:glycosyltransferase involved in cell wall biosynthesis